MRSTSLQDRVTILELAKAGLNDGEIAHRLGWQLATIRKWRRRGQRQGLAGLASRMGRPATGALSSFSVLVKTSLRTWREQHPRWGPLTLWTQARLELSLGGQRLPKRSTLAHWLKQERLTHSYQRHAELALPAVARAQAAHEAWEMDAYGTVQVPGVGMISLINLNDCFSHVKLLSFPCWVGDQRTSRHADTADYLLALRLAFVTWGLPQQLHVDRDSVYFDNTCKSPFPTRLQLFLLGLGITLVVGPPHQPRMRAMTERNHQTWAWQVLEGQSFADWDALWRALETRRTFLNQYLPCAGTDDLPPLVAYPQAAQPKRPYDPQHEPSLFCPARIDDHLALGRWFRVASNNGTVALGDQRYGLGLYWARHEVEITFDPDQRSLIFLDLFDQKTKQHPIKGTAYHDLASDMDRFFQLHPYQLALPLTWSDQRVIRLNETSGVTS